MRRRSFFIVFASLVLALLAPGIAAASSARGAVFTLNNDPAGNRVLVWRRTAGGALVGVGSVATGGTGTGGGLGSQGALTLSPNHHWLYAVNPGSNEISVFRVHGTSLSLREVAPSGGEMPISVTARGRLVYVLNAGGDGNISGFRRNSCGHPEPHRRLRRAAQHGCARPGPDQLQSQWPPPRSDREGHQPNHVLQGRCRRRGGHAGLARLGRRDAVRLCLHAAAAS